MRHLAYLLPYRECVKRFVSSSPKRLSLENSANPALHGDLVSEIASEILSASDAGTSIPLLTSRYPSLDARNAYQVTRAIRDSRIRRGDRPIGRKIGFTNRSIWDEYGVDNPNWSYVYESTAKDFSSQSSKHVSLNRFAEPRIEPEVIFRLSNPPDHRMTDDELLSCIGSVAHGFEIVHSIFPKWKFTGADTTAACALHGALLVGPWVHLDYDGKQNVDNGTDAASVRDMSTWKENLATFKINLYLDDKLVDVGSGSNVLDSPLLALKHLVNLLHVNGGTNDIPTDPLVANEIVTTGTLTRAWPVAAGQTWSTKLEGIPLPGLNVGFE